MNKISRWSSTQTQREVTCPHCYALPGQGCRSPKGRLTHDIHMQRSKLYLTKIGRKEFKRRHEGFDGKIWDADIE
jgi:hypothetical protein